MLKFMRRRSRTEPVATDPLQIRDLMDCRQLQDAMGLRHLTDASTPARFVLRRAEPRSLFGVDVRLVERVR